MRGNEAATANDKKWLLERLRMAVEGRGGGEITKEICQRDKAILRWSKRRIMEEKVGECLIRHLEIRKTLAKRKLTQAGLLGDHCPTAIDIQEGGRRRRRRRGRKRADGHLKDVKRGKRFHLAKGVKVAKIKIYRSHKMKVERAK